jgi:hypothetical protein
MISDNMDKKLADWADAQCSLAQAKAQLLVAGRRKSGDTPAMRDAVARREGEAEKALKELQEEFDAIKRRRAAARPQARGRP